MKLFMLLLGATPGGRNTEQHDVFFGIAESLYALKTDIENFWPEATGSLHIDVSREVNCVDGFSVSVVPAGDILVSEIKLFFINLGGYKKNEFEEFHYKMLVAAKDKALAIQKAKEAVFYKEFDAKGAESHIDDKYGVDVDEIHRIEDVLPKKYKLDYKIILKRIANQLDDELSLGYLPLSKIKN